MRRLAIVALAFGLVSCSDPEVSQILVRIEADPGVVAMTQSLTVFVDGGPNSDVLTRVETITLGGNGYPREIALAPRNDDPTRYYRVVARAQMTPVDDPTDTTFAQAALLGTYIRGETRTVVLRIEDSCIGVPCGETQHCTGSMCVPPPDVTPGPLDGGSADMAMPDMGGSDMGPGRCSTDDDCDDGVDCTIDACTSGTCTYEADSSACAAPSNECLRAVCVVGTGCTEENLTGPCDNGEFCDGTDSCVDGTCTGSGDPCPGMSTCDEGIDACTGCTGDDDCPNGQTCSAGTCTCPTGDTEICGSVGDEDCNGLSDCEDSACNGAVCGANGRVCIEGICDCPGTVELCAAAGDEDCNGVSNCDDGYCEGRTCASGRICITGSCEADVFEICDNGVDDDGDGDVDCEDTPECDTAPCMTDGGMGSCAAGFCEAGCMYEGPEDAEGTCGDGRDNDCDGFTDCGDLSCGGTCTCGGCDDGGTDACVPEGSEDSDAACGDGRDNDCNGFTDCGDVACSFTCACGACDAGSPGPDDFGMSVGLDPF